MNLENEKNLQPTAPEETPPNTFEAAKLQLIPLKDPPWNEWLRLARQGDKTATCLFCAQAEPFIKKLCNDPLFKSRLGKDDTCGSAHLILMEFLMGYPEPPDDKELPILLKGILRRRLLNRVNNRKMLNRREQQASMLENTDETDIKDDDVFNYRANQAEEPEAELLDKDLRRTIAEAVCQLQLMEQKVIRAFFFQNKTRTAIAKELQCSRQNVEKIRVKALQRLRWLLKSRGIFNGGAFCN